MVLEDGKHIPWIKIHNDDEFKLIEGLSTFDNRKSKTILNLILKIKSIKFTDYIFHDNLELKIDQEITEIIEDTAILRNCKLKTIKLLEILEGWYNFLIKYENGEIPGLVYQDQ